MKTKNQKINTSPFTFSDLQQGHEAAVRRIQSDADFIRLSRGLAEELADCQMRDDLTATIKEIRKSRTMFEKTLKKRYDGGYVYSSATVKIEQAMRKSIKILALFCGLVWLAYGIGFAFAAKPVMADMTQNEPTPVLEAPMAPSEVLQAPAHPENGKDGQPSAYQVQTVKEICAAGWTDLYGQQMMEKNISKDDFLEQCRKDLLAIAFAESRFNCDVVGDNSKSLGCFQINSNYHDISDENRQSFAFSAAWTLGRLIRHGWPVNRTYAIKSHNGSGPAADAYASAVKKAAERF